MGKGRKRYKGAVHARRCTSPSHPWLGVTGYWADFQEHLISSQSHPSPCPWHPLPIYVIDSPLLQFPGKMKRHVGKILWRWREDMRDWNDLRENGRLGCMNESYIGIRWENSTEILLLYSQLCCGKSCLPSILYFLFLDISSLSSISLSSFKDVFNLSLKKLPPLKDILNLSLKKLPPLKDILNLSLKKLPFLKDILNLSAKNMLFFQNIDIRLFQNIQILNLTSNLHQQFLIPPTFSHAYIK